MPQYKINPSEEELQDWLTHPVTEFFLEILAEEILTMKDGIFTVNNMEEVAMLRGKILQTEQVVRMIKTIKEVK